MKIDPYKRPEVSFYIFLNFVKFNPQNCIIKPKNLRREISIVNTKCNGMQMK